jgi:hypothetical protein
VILKCKKYYVPNSIGGKMVQIIKKKTEVNDADWK